VQAWRRLAEEGVPVLAVRDDPRSDTAPARCVQAHGPQAPCCAVPSAELISDTPPDLQLPDLPPTVSFLDLSDADRDQESCPPVVGNALVYLGYNHPAATHVAGMAPAVGRALDRTIIDRQGRAAPP
jgi:hypothetical protein